MGHGTSFRAEGAFVRAVKNVFAQSGFKGAGSGAIQAGHTIRLSFCENGELAARENILVEQSCLNCTVYSGRNVVIKGRLQGGSVYAARLLVVGERLGVNSNTPTRIFMGYDPFIARRITYCEQEIERLRQKYAEYTLEAETGPVFEKSFRPKCDIIRQKLLIIGQKRKELWETVFSVQDFSQCKIIVPGEIRPGTEITIGPESVKITDYFSNMEFFLENGELVMKPLSSETATQFLN